MSEARTIRHVALVEALAAAAVLALAGSASAGPIGMVCTNGTVPATGQRVFDLTARTGAAETPDGNSTLVWSYAVTGSGFQTPGPVLCANAGEAITVHLHDALPENTSMAFPGQEGVGAAGGATDGLFTREAASDGDVTYTFTASEPGTYLYESATDQTRQVEMGLFGALVVRPAGHPDWAYADSSTQFDPKREYILVFSEIDPDLH